MDQKVTDLFQRRFPPHQPGVALVLDQIIGHAVDPRPSDCDLAIIWARENPRKNRVRAAVTRNHAKGKLDRTQLSWNAGFLRSELCESRSDQPSKHGILAEQICEFAALIRWAQHHNATKVWEIMIGQVLPEDNAAQGMRHEMDL